MSPSMEPGDDIQALMPPLSEAALFLDFDGTLVDIAPRPDAIEIPPGLPRLLSDLRAACEGAVAVISGRRMEDISGFLPDLGPPLVGGHGAEWWLPGEEPSAHPLAGSEALARVTREARQLAARYAGLLPEEKPTGVVLHYRADPELEPIAEKAVRDWAAAHAGFEVHRAKMAVELRPDDVGKDSAVARLMGKPPFSGRKAAFFGDDATDEPAIGWAEAHGGLGVKVGPGETRARIRLSSPADVRALLSSLL